jgi:hypothetical protein
MRELDPIPYDTRVAYILDWFWSLDSGRDGNGFGPNKLRYSEIVAWSNLHGIELAPWEVDMIKELDDERCKERK